MISFSDIAGPSVNACGMVRCAPDWTWNIGEALVWDQDLWLVTRGTGYMDMDGKVFVLSRGSCFWLQPGMHGHAFHDREDPLSVIYLHFTLTDAQGRPWLPTGEHAPLPYRDLQETEFVEKLASKAVGYYYRGDRSASAHMLRAALLEVIEQDRVRGLSPQLSEHRGQLEALCTGIQAEPGRAAPLRDVARAFGLSPDYLGRLFHRTTGMTYSAYVINARVNQAKHLLQSSALSVGQIAHLLGYSDVFFFSRQFKQRMGISPRAYRNEMLPSSGAELPHAR